MSNAVIADNKPVGVELEKGKEYYFCACGKSKGQPFCDGSHSGTSFSQKLLLLMQLIQHAFVHVNRQEMHLFVMGHIKNLLLMT